MTVCLLLAGDCHGSVTAAITAAADGETILLPSGEIDEHLVIVGRQLTFTTADPAAGSAVLRGSLVPGDAEVLAISGGSSVKLLSLSILARDGRGVTIDDSTLLTESVFFGTDTTVDEGGAIKATDSTVSLGYSRFDGMLTYAGGGAVVASGGAMDLLGDTFHDVGTLGGGGAIQYVGGTLTVVATRFDGTVAQASGGAIAVKSTSLHVERSEFVGTTARIGGGAIAVLDDATATINGTTFEGCSAGSGGALIVVDGGSATIDGSQFVGNTAQASGGAIRASSAGVVLIGRSGLCGNEASASGGAIDATSSAAFGMAGTRIEGNRAFDGAALSFVDTPASAFNIDIVGNEAPGTIVRAEGALFSLGNTIYAYNRLDGAGPAISVPETGAQVTHNLYWQNDATWGPDDDNRDDAPIEADPLLGELVIDGDCRSREDFYPWTAPGVNAGTDALTIDAIPASTWDEGAPDLGAHGGPYGLGDAWMGNDADGWGPAYDCDDDNPDVHPEAEDQPYDDLDADCLGDSDWDKDRDGYDADAHGGPDCNDEDPTISPDAEEIIQQQTEIPVDEDCDGYVDDLDHDGYGATIDCDDDDPNINPGVADQDYDGVDDNCDGYADPIQNIRARRSFACDSTGQPGGIAALLALIAISSSARRRTG